jgi:hypothetical protein
MTATPPSEARQEAELRYPDRWAGDALQEFKRQDFIAGAEWKGAQDAGRLDGITCFEVYDAGERITLMHGVSVEVALYDGVMRVTLHPPREEAL